MQATIPTPPLRVVCAAAAAATVEMYCVCHCALFGPTKLLELLYAAWSAAADAAGAAMLLLLLLMLLPCCCCCEHVHPPPTVTTPRLGLH
jgi:hypothetical protein